MVFEIPGWCMNSLKHHVSNGGDVYNALKHTASISHGINSDECNRHKRASFLVKLSLQTTDRAGYKEAVELATFGLGTLSVAWPMLSRNLIVHQPVSIWAFLNDSLAAVGTA